MARLRAVAVAWMIAAAVACGNGRAPLTSAGARGANVLLVTIDTLRKDRLGAYGSTRGLTPTLDRLAAAGARFDRAFSHVGLTRLGQRRPGEARALFARVPSSASSYRAAQEQLRRLGAEPPR